MMWSWNAGHTGTTRPTPGAPTMQPFNRSVTGPALGRATMRTLVEAISQELWMLFGREGALNWDGAERYLGRIVGQARSDARDPRAARACKGAPTLRPARPTGRRGSVGRPIGGREGPGAHDQAGTVPAGARAQRTRGRVGLRTA